MRRTSLLLCSLLIALCSLCALSEQPPAAESQVELTQFDLSRSGGRSVGRKKTKKEKQVEVPKVKEKKEEKKEEKKVEKKEEEQEEEQEDEEEGEEEEGEEQEGEEGEQEEEEAEEEGEGAEEEEEEEVAEEEEGEEEESGEVQKHEKGEGEKEAPKKGEKEKQKEADAVGEAEPSGGNKDTGDHNDAAGKKDGEVDEEHDIQGSVDGELPTARVQFVTENGAKLDIKGAHALCTMKLILEAAGRRADLLKKLVGSYHKKLNNSIKKAPKKKPALKNSETVQEAHRRMHNLSKESRDAWKRARHRESSAMKKITEVIQQHCVGTGSGGSGKSEGQVESKNCDSSVLSVTTTGSEKAGHNYAIQCGNMSISDVEKSVSHQSMDDALKRWNKSKPKPDTKNLTQCSSEHHDGKEPLVEGPCTVLESWLWDYEETKNAVKRLHRAFRVAAAVYGYIEQIIGGTHPPHPLNATVEAEHKKAEEEEMEESGLHDTAEESMKRAAETKRRSEEMQKAWEMREKRREAKGGAHGVASEEVSVAEDAGNHSFEGGNEEPREADEFEVQPEETLAIADAEVGPPDNETEPESGKSKNKAGKGGRDDGNASDDDPANSESKGGSSAATWVVAIIIPLILLLIGIGVFTFLRRRRIARMQANAGAAMGTEVPGQFTKAGSDAAAQNKTYKQTKGFKMDDDPEDPEIAAVPVKGARRARANRDLDDPESAAVPVKSARRTKANRDLDDPESTAVPVKSARRAKANRDLDDPESTAVPVKSARRAKANRDLDDPESTAVPVKSARRTKANREQSPEDAGCVDEAEGAAPKKPKKNSRGLEEDDLDSAEDVEYVRRGKTTP